MEANAQHDAPRPNRRIFYSLFTATALTLGATAMALPGVPRAAETPRDPPADAQLERPATEPEGSPEPASGMATQPDSDEPAEAQAEGEAAPVPDQPSGAAAEQTEPAAPPPDVIDAQVPAPADSETAGPPADLAAPEQEPVAPAQGSAGDQADQPSGAAAEQTGPAAPPPDTTSAQIPTPEYNPDPPAELAAPAQEPAAPSQSGAGDTPAPTRSAQTETPTTAPPAATPAPRESAGTATVAAPVARRPPLDTGPLMARGNAFLRERDIASARLFFERAAEEGDGAAMLALGRTFDPLELHQMGVLGIKPDAQRALDLYRAAAQAGDSTAPRSLSRLSDWVQRAR